MDCRMDPFKACMAVCCTCCDRRPSLSSITVWSALMCVDADGDAAATHPIQHAALGWPPRPRQDKSLKAPHVYA